MNKFEDIALDVEDENDKKTEEDIYIDDDIVIINDDEDSENNTTIDNKDITNGENSKENQKMSLFAKELFSWIKMLVIAVVIAMFINFVILFNGTVPSGSMVPTIDDPSRIIGIRLAYLFEEPERGDVIIFKYPDDPTQNFVKRIIGLPGETVEIIDGKVYISKDGDQIEYPLDESYLEVEPTGSFGPYVVPEGSYFVIGDNRNDSWDSRYWTNTFVTADAILGKTVVQYWPEVRLIK